MKQIADRDQDRLDIKMLKKILEKSKK